MAVVVLPTPPFWLTTAMTLDLGSAGDLGAVVVAEASGMVTEAQASRWRRRSVPRGTWFVTIAVEKVWRDCGEARKGSRK
jgi:hypothetical protein